MQNIITITLPFFALIGCGYLAGRKGLLGDEGIKGLNAFVFYFALPCLIFSSLAEKPLADIVNPGFMGAYLSASIAVFVAAAFLSRLLFKTTLGMAALQGQAASVGNVGYLALPLITALLGIDAALPVVLGWLVDLIVLVPLSIALLEIDRHATGVWLDFTRNVVRGVVLNPFVLSIMAGVVYAASGFGLPAPLASFTGLLGKAAGPCALFALGATLASRPLSEGLGEAATMSIFKLFIHPAAMWISMTMIFDIEPLWATAAILTAAAPVAGNVYIVAQSFGVYVLRASSAILISTAMAVLTLSALAAYLVN
ncbi:MAG: AEC family transporter [Rhodospirillaceae bacterium]|nr:AEC family transporter [Rhodospirillaceae bacterium]